MKFDPEAKKVSLSLKHALPDPWVEHADAAVRRRKLIAQVVKVTPNYLLVEIFPASSRWCPRASSIRTQQYTPGQDVEVTLLTINSATRRITGSIQHVADVPPEEIEQYVHLEEDTLGTVADAVAVPEVVEVMDDAVVPEPDEVQA